MGKKNETENKEKKFQIRLTELRGIAGKDIKPGTVIAEGTMNIPGMTVEDLNGAFSIKEAIVCEA